MQGSGERWIQIHILLGCQLRAGRGDSLIKGRLCVSLQVVAVHAAVSVHAGVKWVASCLG
jgi:hypothetical protein